MAEGPAQFLQRETLGRSLLPGTFLCLRTRCTTEAQARQWPWDLGPKPPQLWENQAEKLGVIELGGSPSQLRTHRLRQLLKIPRKTHLLIPGWCVFIKPSRY